MTAITKIIWTSPKHFGTCKRTRHKRVKTSISGALIFLILPIFRGQGRNTYNFVSFLGDLKTLKEHIKLIDLQYVVCQLTVEVKKMRQELQLCTAIPAKSEKDLRLPFYHARHYGPRTMRTKLKSILTTAISIQQYLSFLVLLSLISLK